MSDHERVMRMFLAEVDKPMRWVSDLTSTGDFEGREATLEIFDVPVHDQRALLKDLRPVRERARSILGEPLRILFHTPMATTRHHAHVRKEGAVVVLRLPNSPETRETRPGLLADVSAITRLKSPLREGAA